MTQKNKKKKFLNLPKYPGGSAYYKRFIFDNLAYPEEALLNGIEGSVYLSFTVNDFGDVIDAKVIKGLGYGCDEEALRLVRLVKFEKVKNRGIIIQSMRRTRIDFRLKSNKTSGLSINYVLKSTEKSTSTEKKPGDSHINYNYTIKF
ncbi:MAG: energy transducer TonB [Bacteroidetes bacterium]|nr:energy transducer TonB [Bacteroidota bacterium]